MNTTKSQSKDLSRINDNFARETNTRDEDTEMQRYIEEQLIKLQQKSSTNSTQSNVSTNDELHAVFATLRKPEDTLFHVSKHLITDHSAQASEEMLSEQMLSGIPEVDIGVEYVLFLLIKNNLIEVFFLFCFYLEKKFVILKKQIKQKENYYKVYVIKKERKRKCQRLFLNHQHQLFY